MTGILLILLTGILWCCCGIIYSTFAQKRLNFVVIMGIGETLICLLAWFFIADWQVILNQPIPRIHEMLLVLGASGLLGGLGYWLQQLAMQRGPHGVVWTISQSSMIMPFLAGILVFWEPVTGAKLGGMAFVLLSFLVLGWNMSKQDKTEKNGWQWFILALASFLVLGLCQVFCTVPSYWTEWTDIANLRTPIFFSGYCLPFVLPALWRRKRPTRLEFKLALTMTVVGLSGQYSFFLAIDQLKKVEMVSLAFPLAIGISIVTFLLYTVFFLKEKNNWRGWLGFSLALMGMLILTF